MNDPQKHLATVLQFCQRLSDTCYEGLHVRLRTKLDDHLGFLLGTFTPLQLTHLQGVIHLAGHRRYAQAGILARTMLEGYGIMHWCCREPTRAARWRYYALVDDLRLLIATPHADLPDWDARYADLLQDLRQHGRDLLKPRLRGKTDACVIMNPKSYYPQWHVGSDGQPIPIKDVIAHGLSDSDLASFYDYFSAYVHWSPRAIGKHLGVTGSGFDFDITDNPEDGATALSLAFQACGHSYTELADHFDLDALRKALEDLAVDYITALRGLGTGQNG